MKATRPRAVAHRGSVDAAAFVIDPRLIGLPAAQRRVLALWQQGARLYEHDGAWLLHLSAPCRVAVDEAPGLPLVAVDGVLLALPMTEDERRTLRAPAVAWAAGGALQQSPRLGPALEPADWVDVSGLVVVAVSDLGAPPAPPIVALAPVEDRPERLLGTNARLAEGRHTALESVRDAMDRARSAAAGAATGGGASGGGASGGGASGDARLGDAFAIGGGLIARAKRWLRRRLLWRQIGRQHGRYLNEMMEMFDEGRIDEALRHALPLDGHGASGSHLGDLHAPSPRLSLRVTRGATGGVLGLASELFAGLEQRYRVALNRMTADQRFAEAAFILAELLGQASEAVSLLETHALYAEAADIAEARLSDPAAAIRLRLLAGHRERAYTLARRHGVYAPVVDALERRRHVDALALRWEWARHLRDGGDLGAAIAIAWPIEERRDEVIGWLTTAVAKGGPLAASLIGPWLALRPEDFAAITALATALANDRRDAEGPRARAMAASSLMRASANRGAAPLARVLARALVRDAGANLGSPGPSGTAPALRRLLAERNFALGDLRHDIGGLSLDHEPVALASVTLPLRRSLLAQQPGVVAVTDATLLADGRVLVALGEAGARILRPTGDMIARFPVPAHAFVVHDANQGAIAVARRDSVVRLASLAAPPHPGRDLGEVALDLIASDCDGARLLIARDDAISLLDVRATSPTELWGVSRLGGPVQHMARDARSICVVCATGSACFEIWRWDAVTLRLEDRRELRTEAKIRALSPSGSLVVDSASAPGFQLLRPSGTRDFSVVTTTIRCGLDWRAFAFAGPWLAALGSDDEGDDICRIALSLRPATPRASGEARCRFRIYLFDIATLALRMSVEVDRDAGFRLTTDTLVAFDARGRVLVAELTTGAVVAELSVM